MAENSHLISKMPERETGLPNTYRVWKLTIFLLSSYVTWDRFYYPGKKVSHPCTY